MLPNPLSVPDSAPGPSRSHLKIAVPPREEVIPTQVQQWHSQWRSTLASIKDTLGDLERTCESAMEARDAGIEGVIETLVTRARADAQAAAQQARDQAQAEIATVRVALAKQQSASAALQAEVQSERDRLKQATDRLDAEAAARTRAERERDEARRTSQEMLAAAEARIERLRADYETAKAELALLRQELDTANADRARLSAKFQLLQRVLTDGNMGTLLAEPAAASGEPLARAQDRPDSGRPAKASEPARAKADPPLSVNPAARLAEAHPEAVEDINQVLEQVKTMYELDVNAGRSSAELVDSLTKNLRYAREVAVNRSNLAERDAQTLFELAIDGLLDLNAGAAFGRHLSISAYESRRPVTSAPAGSVPATPRES